MYDRREILNRAWELIRGADRARFSLRTIKRNAFRTAWAEAKSEAAVQRHRAALAAKTEAQREAFYAVATLEAKERLGCAGMEQVAELRRAAA